MMTMMTMMMMMIIVITVTIKMPVIPLYTLQCRSYGEIVMGNIVKTKLITTVLVY